jgi:3-oxoacyl-[acyl-carrier protein] reductase
VTGGGQGIGRGIASGFAAAGAEVVVNDLRSERAEEVAEEILAGGGRALVSVFDVTEHAEVTSALDRLDGVDILVNNAGNAGRENHTSGRGLFVDTAPADWEPYIRVNLYGVLYCTRAALPGMIAQGWGRVITIVSDTGRTGDKYMAAYSAAKAGAAGLTRSLALETGQFGVTVNNIALGTMRTPLSEAFWSEPGRPEAKAILQNYVVRRPGLPEDVASLALFLASSQASWITGQTYPPNGGYSFAL